MYVVKYMYRQQTTNVNFAISQLLPKAKFIFNINWAWGE